MARDAQASLGERVREGFLEEVMHKLIEGAGRSQGEGRDGGGVDGRLRTTAKDPHVGLGALSQEMWQPSQL